MPSPKAPLPLRSGRQPPASHSQISRRLVTALGHIRTMQAEFPRFPDTPGPLKLLAAGEAEPSQARLGPRPNSAPCLQLATRLHGTSWLDSTCGTPEEESQRVESLSPDCVLEGPRRYAGAGEPRA